MNGGEANRISEILSDLGNEALDWDMINVSDIR